MVEAVSKAALAEEGERATKSSLVITARFKGAGFFRGAELEHFGNAHRGRISSIGGGGSKKGLRKHTPKLERDTRERMKVGVDESRVDGRAESKVGGAGRALGEVSADGFRDGSAKTVAKAERVKVVNGEKA